MCLCSVAQKYEIKKQLISDFYVIFAESTKTINITLWIIKQMQISDTFIYEQFVRICV